jgi:hypothetical protein
MTQRWVSLFIYYCRQFSTMTAFSLIRDVMSICLRHEYCSLNILFYRNDFYDVHLPVFYSQGQVHDK